MYSWYCCLSLPVYTSQAPWVWQPAVLNLQPEAEGRSSVLAESDGMEVLTPSRMAAVFLLTFTLLPFQRCFFILSHC